MKINEKTLIRYSTSNMVSADMEGFLYKRGEVNRSFQKRWCILKGNCLFYFEKKHDREPLGCILLEGSRIEIDDNETELFAFKLVFSGHDCRDYVFATDNSENQEKWMKALSQASYSYLKMVVAELQRQLDEINLAERRRMNETEEGTYERPQRSNPFNSSREDLIDLDDQTSNNQEKNVLFSRRPFIEIHQYYGLQFRSFFQMMKEKQMNSHGEFNSGAVSKPPEIDLLS